MKRTARTAFPDKYAAALARKRARTAGASLSQTQRIEVEREVKKELNKRTDFKFWDVTTGSAAIDFSGSIFSTVSGLIRGNTGDTFEGDSIIPKYLQVRYTVNAAALTGGDWNVIRVIIGQSQRGAIGSPTPDNVLQTIGTAQSSNQMRQFDRMKNYKILYDKTHTLVAGQNTAESCNVFIKGSRLNSVEFTSSGALSITGGDIWVLAISDDGLTSYPGFRGVSRLVFSD